MKLALFDLDHTLIPFDSGMAWTRFLMAKGFLPADADARYLAYCHAYVAGTLDIRAMHQGIAHCGNELQGFVGERAGWHGRKWAGT